MINDWQLCFSFVFIALGILWILCWLLLRFTLDRRVRKALPADKEYDAFPDMYLGFGRAFIFGGFCVFDHMNNAPMYKELYDNFDVRTFANRFETFIAYSMMIAFFIFIALAIFLFSTDVLGLIDWS